MQRLMLDENRTNWIDDFDGVHYLTHIFNDVYGSIYKFYGLAKLKAFRLLLPELKWSDEEVIYRGKESYLQHKDGIKIYVDFAKASGMIDDDAGFYRRFHREYHKAAFQNAMATHATSFAPCADTNRAYESLRPYIKRGLLTMSCVQTWAGPLMTEMETIGFYEPDALLGAKETNDHNKKDSTYPLERAMEKLGARPETTVFQEETVENLYRAKQLDKRILTVLVDPSATKDTPLPECVDIRVPSSLSSLKLAQEVFGVSAAPARPAPALILG
jgi:hypothetical protein